MLRQSLVVLIALTTVGCASTQNTPAQDAVWAAYNQCRAEGRVPANVQLMRVDPDGRAHYQTYTSSYGGADFERCLAEKSSRPVSTDSKEASETAREPISLDSSDPQYGDYLTSIKRMIKDKWLHPCLKNEATGKCEYKSAKLVVEFGIFADGRLAHVVVRESSGMEIYDQRAVSAIETAAPFPPVPPALMAKAKSVGAGVKINAAFRYDMREGPTPPARP